MIRPAGLLFLAALLAPVAAFAQTVAVTAPQATVRGVDKEQLARCGAQWTEALARTGLETVATAGKGRGDAAVVKAEFVAGLSVERDGDSVVFTGLASRVRLDKWSARHEARAPLADPAAWDEALGVVADSIAVAVRTAPPRETTQPPARPRVKLKVAGRGPGAEDALAAPAEEPGSPVDGDAGDEAGDGFAAPAAPVDPADDPEPAPADGVAGDATDAADAEDAGAATADGAE
jgi:hypothetical protein